jgi:hypothetical protein
MMVNKEGLFDDQVCQDGTAGAIGREGGGRIDLSRMFAPGSGLKNFSADKLRSINCLPNAIWWAASTKLGAGGHMLQE